jgi:hypothetical protein
MTAGVYAIRNSVTNTIYIGSSQNIERRWLSHRAALRSGRHSVAPLQAAWVADGEQAFAVELLDEVPSPLTPGALNSAEEAWFERMRADGALLYVRWFHARADAREHGKAHPIKVALRNQFPRMSQPKLARRLGLSEATLSRYLSNREVPPDGLYPAVAAILGVPESELRPEPTPEEVRA